MKKIKFIVFTFVISLVSFFAIVYTSCTPDRCAGVSCQNGGYCNGGNCICPLGYVGSRCQNLAITTIEYQNNTYTPITITINGSATTIQPTYSVQYTGYYGDNISGNAITYGQTSSGTQIGLALSWTISNTFPTDGTLVVPLNINNNYFFLKLQNNSAETTNSVIVNVGLTAQTTDNIAIPNNGAVYGTGYYYAYTNTEVQAVTNTYTYSWYPTFNFTNNQSIILTFP